MTNDSHFFRTAAQLDYRLKASIPYDNNCWKRGRRSVRNHCTKGRWCRRSITAPQSVIMKPENVNRPNQSATEASLDEHIDPSRLGYLNPCIWVGANSFQWPDGVGVGRRPSRTCNRDPLTCTNYDRSA